MIACLFLTLASLVSPLIDLEESTDDFAIESKRIYIPGYEWAFNPSIARWENGFVLCFRTLPDMKNTFTSHLGLILLNEEFIPVSRPQILNLTEDSPIPPRSEDGRLIWVADRLYLIYSDNREPLITKGGFRMFAAEIRYKNGQFSASKPVCFAKFPGESREVREKNWVPFDYVGNLLLAYSIVPHRIFRPNLKTGVCTLAQETKASVNWDWGIIRGGTPALRIGDEYLSFFHSSIKTESVQTTPKKALHYYMGAYTFELHPPYALKKISPRPIFGPNFYTKHMYKPYKNWSSVQGVFPGGYVFNNSNIWVVFGRQDHEIWVVKFDKKKLMQSLVSVKR